MRVTRLATIGGVVVLGLLCWLAAVGVTAITEVLVTVFALVVLVGGGNWLSGRGGTRSRPTYAGSGSGGVQAHPDDAAPRPPGLPAAHGEGRPADAAGDDDSGPSGSSGS